MAEPRKSVVHDHSGTTAVEYGLIVGLIAGVLITTVGVIDGEIAGSFQKIALALETYLR